MEIIVKKVRKIPMKRIENHEKRLVCFCKRRQGLFSKADTLHKLTGADIAVIVFSETGRPHFYGSEATLDRYLVATSSDPSPTGSLSPPPIEIAVKSCIERIDQSLSDSGDSDLQHLTALRAQGEEMRERLMGQLRTDPEDDYMLRLLESVLMED